MDHFHDRAVRGNLASNARSDSDFDFDFDFILHPFVCVHGFQPTKINFQMSAALLECEKSVIRSFLVTPQHSKRIAVQ
jgi:hypothetical protein